MKSNKVIVIGIDSMDARIVELLGDQLPTLRKIASLGTSLHVSSVIPPDSHTAWASLYTGLTPPQHGVFHFLDPFEKATAIETEERYRNMICGKTIWDEASLRGLRVCVLFPHLCYPPWNVNGLMISRSSWKDELAGTSDKHTLPELDRRYSTLKTIPGNRREIHEGLTRARDLTARETDLYLSLLKKEEWDLFFCYSSCLDWVQHYAWPSNRDVESYSLEFFDGTAILEFYEVYDRMVHKIISGREDRYSVIVVSDHGHESRPTKLVNTDSVIAATLAKFPSLNQRPRHFGVSVELTGSLFNAIQSTVSPGKIQRFATHHPVIVKLYHAFASRERKHRAIQAMSISRLKAYRYGGIVFSDEMRESSMYEKVREELIRSFSELRHPVTREPLTLFARRREDLYSGKFLDLYPDVVIFLCEGFGLTESPTPDLMLNADRRSFSPGSHNAENACLMMNLHPSLEDCGKNIELTDLHDIIAGLLSVDVRLGADRITNCPKLSPAELDY